MESTLMFMGLIIGGIFILMGLIMYFFPPKKRNSLYGYRTSRSMKSDEAWHFSQKYSAVAMIIMGTVYTLVDMLLAQLQIFQQHQEWIGILIMIGMVIALIVVVEIKLKKKFR